MMSLKALGARLLARWVHQKTRKWAENPVEAQRRTFDQLIAKGRGTGFGAEHGFSEIRGYSDFSSRVPVRDYETLKPYVERIFNGEDDVLWPGKPLYFAKTSGTTSGAKYIPITRESIKEQVRASRNAILNYIHKTGNVRLCKRKDDFSSGQSDSR